MIRSAASITIVGGGFSGTVTAIQLARGAQPGRVHITLIDSTPAMGGGLAYRFDDDNLLLNVPAGNMSALAEDPVHFVRYCQKIDPSISVGSFVSRRLYGQYLQDTLAHTQVQYPGVLTTVIGEVRALQRSLDLRRWHIHLTGGQVLPTDQVVLAFGHQPPRFPLVLGSDELPLVSAPWDFDTMHHLPSGKPVLVLGTGHTAVDALFCLSQAQPHRPVVMVSRHGLLPQPHRLNPHAPIPHGFPCYLQGVPSRIRAYLRAFRLHLCTQDAEGFDWRDALNELRPHTPQLWQSLPAADQGRFLRHLQAYWDVHRHRLAPMAAQRLDRLLASGRVHTVAARLVSLQRQGDGLAVQLCHRGTGQLQSLHVCAIVNATGPDADASRATNPLFVQLQRDGLIQPHPNGLGLCITPEHQVLGAQNQPVDCLWYVGPMLKAQLWEATAVPELRVHARQLAQTLLACLNAGTLPKASS